MNINRSWKRGIAIGCSHGHLLDPVARAFVLKLTEHWQPQTMLHLGDWNDFAAFMSNIKRGSPEEGQDPQIDFDAGCDFLREYYGASRHCDKRVTFNGNHEDRLWKLRDSTNAIVSFAASKGIEAINDFCKEVNSDWVDYDNLIGWRKLGDTLFGHGYMFNENCPRDHAEAFGKCVIAHWHRVGMAKGRRNDNPTGYCVGTLAAIPGMRYAKTNKSRLAWSMGLAYFEYCDDSTVVHLLEGPKQTPDFSGAVPTYKVTGEWRMPHEQRLDESTTGSTEQFSGQGA